MRRFLRPIAESGPVTRGRTASRNRNRSRSRSASRNRSNGSGTRKRTRNRNGPVTRTMRTAMNAARRITRARRPRRNENEQRVPQIFNPIARQAAEEGYNSNQSGQTSNTEPYSEHNDNFTNFNNALVPVRANSRPLLRSNSAHLEPQPLGRRLSAAERPSLQRTGSVSENSQLHRYFSFIESASEENSPPNSQPLERSFISVSKFQSPLRFVLYTGDVEIAIRFTGIESIPIKYNSKQNVGLDVVFLNQNAGSEIAEIRRRLPASVQYLSDQFTDGQYNNALTVKGYFLLTIEQDTRTPGPHDQLTAPPTGEIYGVLCCSEETATVDSSRFVDSAGTSLINFRSLPGTQYIYVHLFTYLSAKTLGDQFFTGSLMLEGLYNLFNPRGDERIIYLEAIRVDATVQFYERFGMERLNQMVLTSSIPGNPPISVYFDPFKGVVVPDEIPFVLRNRRQIEQAAAAAQRMRQSRNNATAHRLHLGIVPSALRQPTPEERRRLENAVSNFLRERARIDPRAPPVLILRPGP